MVLKKKISFRYRRLQVLEKKLKIPGTTKNHFFFKTLEEIFIKEVDRQKNSTVTSAEMEKWFEN